MQRKTRRGMAVFLIVLGLGAALIGFVIGQFTLARIAMGVAGTGLFALAWETR